MTNGQGGSAILDSRSDHLAEAKQRQRRQAGIARDKLHADQGSAAAIDLASGFVTAIPVARGGVVAGYWPMGSEIDVRPLCRRLRRAGSLTALPVVLERHGPLIFRAWDEATELARGPFGTSQPSEASDCVEPDILLVPLLAFDRCGSRLGYGGGYYDRTLAAMRERRSILAIGVGFDGQRVDRLEVGPHDARLDGIVTERNVYHPIPR